MKIGKKIGLVVLAGAVVLPLAACQSDADTVSKNISTDADQFKVERRIVFYNGITGAYILDLQGMCSLGNDDPAYRLSVTCKTGDNSYEKHYLGLSQNVTYFAQQLASVPESKYHETVVFKPTSILPNIELETSGK